MAKIHSYPWYPADWRGSEARLTMSLEERAIYRELLDHHYEQGSLPNDERGLRMIAGCDKEEFDRAWPRVSKQFYEQDGRLYQSRVLEKLVELGELSDKRKNIAKKAADARYKHAQSMLDACSKHAQGTAKEVLEACPPSSPTTTITSSSKNVLEIPKKPVPTNEEVWNEPPSPSQVFIEAYPKKVGVQLAIQTYESVVKPNEHQAVMEGLERWKVSEAWATENGKYIHNPAKWLADRLWLDHPPRAAPPKEEYTIFMGDLKFLRHDVR